MSLFNINPADVFAPVDGNGNARSPVMEDAQTLMVEFAAILNALTVGSALLYTSQAALAADLAHAANTAAIVMGDAIAANNGWYSKSGASGSGSWIRVADVPGFPVILATNAGAGTANAIVATTPNGLPSANGGALVGLPIVATNTLSPVTVAFDGGSALTIRTAGGTDPVVGGIIAGSILWGYKYNSTFRLIGDQASSAVLTAAENALTAANAIIGPARGPIFAYEGDSLSYTALHGTWPLQLKAMSGFFARGTSYYFATGGDTASAMVGEFASQAGAISIASGQEAYFSLWAGTNDIAAGDSAATIYNNLKTIWAAARAQGFKVIAFTVMKRGTFNTAQEAVRVALNVLILSDATLYDFIVRPDVAFLNVVDANVFDADTIHLTANGPGNKIVAQLFAAAVLGVRAQPAASLSAHVLNALQINGNVAVSQQFGTSSQTLASGTPSYTADMWQGWYTHGAGTAFLTSGRVSVGDLAGFLFAHEIKATTALSSPANGDFAAHRTCIEGYRLASLYWGAAAARPLSLGFWFYATVSGTAFLRVQSGAGDAFYHHEFAAAAGWNWVTATIPGPTIGTWDTSTGVGAAIMFFAAGKAAAAATADVWGASGATMTANNTNLLATNNNATRVTGLTVLPGIELPDAESSPLIHRPFPDALDQCRRYFYTWNTEAQSGNGLFNGALYTTTLFRGILHFPRPMRAVPTMSYSALSDLAVFFNSNGGATPSALALNNGGTEQAEIGATVAAATIGWGGWVRAAATGARVHFDARL